MIDVTFPKATEKRIENECNYNVISNPNTEDCKMEVSEISKGRCESNLSLIDGKERKRNAGRALPRVRARDNLICRYALNDP